MGSSPLTRGKHLIGCQTSGTCRLIPAHAGKTDGLRVVQPRAWAHPRSRGENCASNVERKPSWGSSPLTRGKRRDRQIQEHPERLIPAHAGKTTAVSRTTTSLRAHPRSRGENVLPARGWASHPGSSPLTRGKHVLVFRVGGHPGLIPAHAGKTSATSRNSSNSSAHPRSRGENLIQAVPMSVPLGSSPLTRGKRAGRFDRLVNGRLIPAHAGKTRRMTH